MLFLNIINTSAECPDQQNECKEKLVEWFILLEWTSTPRHQNVACVTQISDTHDPLAARDDVL